METTESYNQDKFNDNLSQKKDCQTQESCLSFFDDNDTINAEGCSFFVKPKHSEHIYITSYKLRWFTYKFDPKHTEQQVMQEEARKVVTDEAQQSPNKSGKLSMSILLYADPTKLKDEESEYIKFLLKCQDVTIKYLETKEMQRLRISMRGSRLLLSMSGKQENKVVEGFLYKAENENSPLLNYVRSKFTQDFERAKEITLNEKEKIVFKSKLDRFIKWCKSERGTIIGVIGTIIGVIGLIYNVWKR